MRFDTLSTHTLAHRNRNFGLASSRPGYIIGRFIVKLGTPLPDRQPDALDPVALYGPCRDGGLDKGTLAMTLSGLRGRARALPVPPDQRTGHRPLSSPPLRGR